MSNPKTGKIASDPQVVSMVYCMPQQTVVVSSRNNSPDPQTRHDSYDLDHNGDVDFYQEAYPRNFPDNQTKYAVAVNPQLANRTNPFYRADIVATPAEARAAQIIFHKGVRAAGVALGAYELARKSGKIDSKNLKFSENGMAYSASWDSGILFIYQAREGGAYFTYHPGHHCSALGKSVGGFLLSAKAAEIFKELNGLVVEEETCFGFCWDKHDKFETAKALSDLVQRILTRLTETDGSGNGMVGQATMGKVSSYIYRHNYAGGISLSDVLRARTAFDSWWDSTTLLFDRVQMPRHDLEF